MPDPRAQSAPAHEPPMSRPAGFNSSRQAHLSYLKLNDAVEALNRVLDAARSKRLSLTAALERLPEIEVSATEDRRLASRLRFACLPVPWTINGFNFTAQPCVDEKLIRDLATLRFLDDAATAPQRRSRSSTSASSSPARS